MGLLDIFNTKARRGVASQNLQWTLNSVGEWVYPSEDSTSYIDSGYKEIPNVYAVISLILDKSSIVPFEVYKVKSKSSERKYKALMNDPKNYVKALKYKNEAYEKIEGTALEEVFSNPNTYQSLEELWYQIDGYKLLTGNSYLYHVGVGSTNELHNIPAPLVELLVKGNAFEPEFNYKVSYLKEVLSGEDVMHFKYFNPITGGKNQSEQYRGQSPLQSCRKLLGRYRNADITQGFQFENMGPAGMITGQSNTAEGLTEPQANAIQRKFKQQHTGVHKAGDVLVTPSALTWTSFGLSPTDLNIIEGKREMLAEICNVYKAPMGLFSDTNSTENNMIESRKSLITDAVIPLIESRKSVLNKFLAPKFGDYVIEFDYSVFHEMQEDIDKQADAASKMYWTTLNEKRALTGYDRDEDPNMDKVYIPSGLTALDDLNEPEGEINEDLLDTDA